MKANMLLCVFFAAEALGCNAVAQTLPVQGHIPSFTVNCLAVGRLCLRCFGGHLAHLGHEIHG